MAGTAGQKVSLVDLPENVILKIQVAAGDPPTVYGLESLACSAVKTSEAAWAVVLEMLFPALFLRLCAEDFCGSYKQVFTRRARRAEEWRRRKQKVRSESFEEAKVALLPTPTKQKPHNKLLFADNRQGHLADSTLGLKVCGRCGEKYTSANRVSLSCHYHEGFLLPHGPEASALTRSDRQQISKSGKFALRKCGGVAGRRSRQGGRGHWTKGLGLPAVVAGKVMVWEDVCVGPGEVLCAWSCCSKVGLFADGCTVGTHRPS
mmetsp:Transcript_22588/g.42571  ORF Transcript_22588/g.42571 Transcript_22588/m.42571 type:complete len:262 (+) Transcript_22588:68-853(+)